MLSLSQSTPEQLLGELNDIERKNAPAVLYCAGDMSLLNAAPRIAIVGSRAATAAGVKRAAKLTRLLVERGAVIVSGMAEGIDTVAHQNALNENGRTIAVLGSPLDAPYPASNRYLFERIVAEGLVVSQFATGSAIQPKNFPIRNRTMALLSHATVIVEAGEKSGTLHQAWEALRLGRPLFLLESVADDATLTWPAKVQHYGAQVLSEQNLDEFLNLLPEGHFEEAVAF